MKPVFPIAGAFLLGLVGATLFGTRSGSPAPATKAALPPAVAVPPALHAPSTVEGAVKSPSDAPAADTVAGLPADSSASRAAAVLLKLAPEDAAPIAARMNDTDLVPVLRLMGVDKAAPLLARLPTIRSRDLSKRLLTPAAGGTP
ncbi:MAG TPA: hypothetical protein VGL65_07365 [Gemmatimonadales bacterium]|jgi:hypothetical protein